MNYNTENTPELDAQFFEALEADFPKPEHSAQKMFREEGLKPPMSVNISTRQYAQQSDKIGNFIGECLEECQGGGCTAKEAYDAYRKWCSDCGYFAEGKQKFIELLRGKNLLKSTATLNGKTAFNIITNYLISY